MKRIVERRPQTSVMVYRVLIVIAIMLALILIVGTIYGLVKQGKTGPGSETNAAGGENIFSGIGTMRIPTADPNPETVIIRVAFPYDKNDRPFSEELASQIAWFKTATAQYLGAFTAEELSAADVDIINSELLVRYNSTLRLGQIKELYIEEFMRL